MTRLLPWAVLALTSFALPQESGSDQAPQTPTQRFVSRGKTWSMDVPESWRQVSPAEARQLGDALPWDMRRQDPLRGYSIGAVDQWLAQGFDGIAVHAVETEEEFVHDDALPGMLRRHWRQRSSDNDSHEIDKFEVIHTGADKGFEALTAIRTTTFKDGSTWKALDAYIPTGGRELILSFRARPDLFDQWRPRFDAMLASVRLRSPARGQPSLMDRLYWPITIGGLVLIGLLMVQRAARRQDPDPTDPGHPPQKS